MTIEFNDRLYRFTWGKAPRGYGGWTFKSDAGLTCKAYGTLSEAKRIARSWAKRALPDREYIELEIEA